jgi:hypothetical protein
MCGFGETERVYFPDVFTGYFIDFYCLGTRFRPIRFLGPAVSANQLSVACGVGQSDF